MHDALIEGDGAQAAHYPEQGLVPYPVWCLPAVTCVLTPFITRQADQFEKMHDFARAYGALCWNLSKV